MQFEAMAPVLPEIAAAMAVVRQADFTAALIRRLAERFFAGLRLVEHAPGFELFADRNAGVLIAYSLLLSGERGDAFPPQRPVRLSISAAARRFGVSRVHVRKLLRDAEEQGYLARVGSADGEVAAAAAFHRRHARFHCQRLPLSRPLRRHRRGRDRTAARRGLNADRMCGPMGACRVAPARFGVLAFRPHMGRQNR